MYNVQWDVETTDESNRLLQRVYVLMYISYILYIGKFYKCDDSLRWTHVLFPKLITSVVPLSYRFLID